MVELTPSPSYPRPNPTDLLARPLGYLLSPVLIAQGRLVRKKYPRLPNAPLPWSGTITAAQPIRLLGLGDSTIAGVGVDNPMLGLTAQIAKVLYAELGRGVNWDSFGQRGITSGELLRSYVPEALDSTPPADLVVISIGANDAKSLHSRRATSSHVTQILDAINDHSPQAVVMVSSLPAFGLFESLPDPLRTVLARHAAAIDRTLRPVVEERPYAFMSPPPRHYPPTFFAHDGFHPSAEGYRVWAEFAVADAVSRGALAHLLPR